MGELLLELDTRDIIEHNSPVNIKIINNTNDNLRYKILIGKDGIWETLREFEKEGKIGSLHRYFYTTVGNGTSVANSKRFAAEFAQELRNDGVDAVILTST